MQENFVCSAVNRQVGCKQYTSAVVGGPVTTTLPVCSVLVCGDNCTTGNIDYEIDTLSDFYGKRMVIIKTVDTTASAFSIRIISPSSDFVSTGTTTLTLPDLPSTTELVFPIGPGPEIGVSIYDGSSGAPSTNIYNSDGALTANRIVDLNFRNLTVQGTGNINLGTANTTTVTIGRNASQCNLNNSTIVATNLGQINLATPNNSLSPYNVLLMNTATKVVNSVPVNYFTRSLFCVPPATATGTIAASSTTSLTPWSGTYGTTYRVDAGTVDLATGIITVPTSTPYLVMMRADLKNSASVGRYRLELYDGFGAVVSSEQHSPVVDDYNTCMLSATIILNPSPITYTFRIVNLDTAGTTSYRNVLMSISRI